MPLLIHIGTDKTGTTSLQTMLADPANAAPLAGIGMRYAVAGRARRANHQELHWRANENNFDLWRTLAEELEDYPDQINVVSFEGLYHLNEAAWLEIRKILGTLDVRLMIYLRRQSDLVRSGIAQLFKSGQNLKLSAYDEEKIFERRQNYLTVLEKFERVFGDAALRVRRYERSAMREGNLYVDFLQASGGEISLDQFTTTFRPAEDVNPTLDVESIHLLDWLDREGIDAKARRDVVKRLLAECANKRTTIVRDSTARRIDDSLRDANRIIARKWFSSDYLFSEPSRFTYAEPDEQVIERYLGLVSPLVYASRNVKARR